MDGPIQCGLMSFFFFSFNTLKVSKRLPILKFNLCPFVNLKNSLKFLILNLVDIKLKIYETF